MDIRKIAAAVDAWALCHRDEMVQDLIRLIRIPSVSSDRGRCREAVEQLMQLGRQYGFEAEHDEEYSASILWRGTKQKGELGLLGHLDVVEPGEGWRFDPFGGCERDGYVIGRGSSDNKGPVIMALYVMRCMKELGMFPNRDVRLIAGCNEETDMMDVRRYLQMHPLPDFTLNCDGAWAACIGEKGILTADLVQEVNGGNLLALWGGVSSNAIPAKSYAVVTELEEDVRRDLGRRYPELQAEREESGVKLSVTGAAAHCCTPARGVNANIRLLQILCENRLLTGDAQEKAARLLACFEDDYGTALRIQHEDALSGRTTCVGSMLRFENGALRMHINVRFAVTQNSMLMMQSLKKRLEKLGLRLENVSLSPARNDSAEQPEIRLLVDTCRELLGKKHKPYVMGGGTYSRCFPRSVPFGPADLNPRIRRPFGSAHGADEAVCVDELLQGIKVYAAALLRLDQALSNNKEKEQQKHNERGKADASGT